ncbi:hypothetical protein L3X38_026761 [Prunus dulcis]|uniref:Uncharacterized protein n=1 Tax=Prunus dulcis TaxID=3755 RepID=A0AAD4VLN7_PRUDU|nr:hypothetical protein L3X38_026761 [Prunus dulcis]
MVKASFESKCTFCSSTVDARSDHIGPLVHVGEQEGWADAGLGVKSGAAISMPARPYLKVEKGSSPCPSLSQIWKPNAQPLLSFSLNRTDFASIVFVNRWGKGEWEKPQTVSDAEVGL